MKYCTNCKCELPDDNTFCPECGNKTGDYAPQPEDKKTSPVADTVEQDTTASTNSTDCKYWTFASFRMTSPFTLGNSARTQISLNNGKFHIFSKEHDDMENTTGIKLDETRNASELASASTYIIFTNAMWGTLIVGALLVLMWDSAFKDLFSLFRFGVVLDLFCGYISKSINWIITLKWKNGPETDIPVTGKANTDIFLEYLSKNGVHIGF